jgi:hypothetical protein
MRRYFYTPCPYPGSSGAWSSSFRDGVGCADTGDALAAGRGVGKKVCVVFGWLCGSRLVAFMTVVLVLCSLNVPVLSSASSA